MIAISHNTYRKIMEEFRLKGTIHLAAGLTVGIYTSVSFVENPVYAIGFTWACMLGSILPDIDSPKAMISKCIPIIPIWVNRLFGHRGITHAPAIPLLMYMLIKLFEGQIPEPFVCLIYGFILGYAIHLFQDAFTVGGIPILYPFSKYKLRFSHAKSGSFWNYPATVLIITIWVMICTYGKEAPVVAYKSLLDLSSHILPQT